MLAGREHDRSVIVDQLVVATGFRPQLDFLREVRLSLDPAVECPPILAPLIDPNLHSCGTVRPHGARELAQPEPGFYFAGIKSYGDKELSITAGNSCPTNDGFTSVLLMSEEMAMQLGLEPLARIVGFGVAGAVDGCFHRIDFIHGYTKIDRDSSIGLDNPGDGEIVGSDDLRRSKRPDGCDQFVACCKNGDPCAAADHERGASSPVGRSRSAGASILPLKCPPTGSPPMAPMKSAAPVTGAPRSDDIARAAGLSVALRSRGELPNRDVEIYVADTLGELGLIYRLAPIVFMGGSLARRGGQNPIEAVRMGAAVMHGPHVWNFGEIYATLDAVHGAESVADADALTARLGEWLAKPAERATVADAAKATVDKLGGALERTLAALEPYLMQLRLEQRAS